MKIYKDNQEETNKKPPRPIILISKAKDNFSVITPKSMELLSDGILEESDSSLAGYTWSIPLESTKADFQIGSHIISYTLSNTEDSYDKP